MKTLNLILSFIGFFFAGFATAKIEVGWMIFYAILGTINVVLFNARKDGE